MLSREGLFLFFSELGLDSGDKHPGAERFGYIVVRAAGKTCDNVIFFAFGGQHDDGRWGITIFFPDYGTYFHAVPAGQHQVQKNQVNRFALKYLQSLFAGVRAGHMKAGLDQIVADQLLDVDVVFHNKDIRLSHVLFLLLSLYAQQPSLSFFSFNDPTRKRIACKGKASFNPILIKF